MKIQSIKLADIDDKLVVNDLVPVVIERLKSPSGDFYDNFLIHIKDDDTWKPHYASKKYIYVNMKSVVNAIIHLSNYDIDESNISVRFSSAWFNITVLTNEKYPNTLMKYFKKLGYTHVDLRYAYHISYIVKAYRPKIYPAIGGILKRDNVTMIKSVYLGMDLSQGIEVQDELTILPEFEENAKTNVPFNISKNLFVQAKTWYKKLSEVDDMRLTLFDSFIVGMEWMDMSYVQNVLEKQLSKL